MRNWLVLLQTDAFAFLDVLPLIYCSISLKTSFYLQLFNLFVIWPWRGRSEMAPHLFSNTAANRQPEKRSLVSRPQHHLLNKSTWFNFTRRVALDIWHTLAAWVCKTQIFWILAKRPFDFAPDRNGRLTPWSSRAAHLDGTCRESLRSVRC